MFPLIFGKLGITEILIILIIVVIFFGGKKIPELMRGMGRGVREFKEALDGKPDEERPAERQENPAERQADAAGRQESRNEENGK